LQHHATIHRLRFEEVIATDGNAEKARTAREEAEAGLTELQSTIAPLQQEINQLGRQFWVNKEQVKANNYDLSASRYRQVEQEEMYYEEPEVTLERLRVLDKIAASELDEIMTSLTNR
jgi:type I restriction enzyme M protein